MAALPGDLRGWLEVLEQRHAEPIRLGLDRVRSVFAAMNLRIDAVVITVGGTNGKGSACAMLEAILIAAGYRTGLYTSPHLLRYTERVRRDGRDVDEATLVAAFNEVERARGAVPLTYFEHGTLAAWSVFASEALDVVILEVGLGGRLDAVNVLDPDCALVTSVGIDHTQYLGNTREQIGYEKAGIFRAGRPAVCGDPCPPASLLAHAQEIGAQLWVSGRDYGFKSDSRKWDYWRLATHLGADARVYHDGLVYPSLRGASQLFNASAVLTVLELLHERVPVSPQAIRQGLLAVVLPGRFQVLPGKPVVVLDVAHNPHAASVLARNLSDMGAYPRTWAVFGMLADKDVQAVVSPLCGMIDHWLLASLPGARGLSAERLELRLRQADAGGDVRCFDTPAEAYSCARQFAGESDRILVFGSFMTVADVLAAMQAVG